MLQGLLMRSDDFTRHPDYLSGPGDCFYALVVAFYSLLTAFSRLVDYVMRPDSLSLEVCWLFFDAC